MYNCNNVHVGVVTIIPREGGTTYVNGTEISEPTKLTTGCRIILGNNHVFRYNNPDEGNVLYWCMVYMYITCRGGCW